MTDREFADYRKQNPYARIISSSNFGGQRSLTVDCGSAATSQQVGSQTLEEYKEWRKTQGMGNGLHTGRPSPR